MGGLGSDSIDGGTGIDEVDYSTDAAAGGEAGVTVDLSAGTATDGFGDSDTLSNIENVTATAEADHLTGSDDANIILGQAGDDVIAGRGG